MQKGIVGAVRWKSSHNNFVGVESIVETLVAAAEQDQLQDIGVYCMQRLFDSYLKNTICILPRSFFPKFKCSIWMEDMLRNKYLHGFDYHKVVATKEVGKDYLLDLEKLERSLPEVSSTPVFICLIVPTPCGSRYKDGKMLQHANTVFINPDKKEIYVNEPLTGNQGIQFSVDIIILLKRKYPDYKVINESCPLQEPGETTCGYLALKVAQYYHQNTERTVPPSRTRMLSEWHDDMEYLISTRFGAQLTYPNSGQNFNTLTDHLGGYLAEKARHFVDTNNISNLFALFYFRIIYPHISAVFLSHISSNNAPNFEKGVPALSRLFCYLDRGVECNALSPEGEIFINKLWGFYQQYFDMLIKKASITSTSSNEMMEQAIQTATESNPIKDTPFHNDILIVVRDYLSPPEAQPKLIS